MTSLKADLEEYITLRRAFGTKFREGPKLLQKFVALLDSRGAAHVTVPLALEWATANPRASASRHARLLNYVRHFALFLQGKDTRHEVPPDGMLYGRCGRLTPYRYSNEELQRIFEAARKLPPPARIRGPGIRGETCFAIIGLLAATGMRVGEVLRLDRDDVDLDNGLLTVRWSKFNKSRLIPVHASTRDALFEYARRRNAAVHRPHCKAFFLTDLGSRVAIQTIQASFRQVCREVAVARQGRGRGPRLHDLRHRFAVETLLSWYRQGLDSARRLPVLATYLGHVSVVSTYWYLEAVPELLQLASGRSGLPAEVVP